eukprot:6181935-Pleurochrysis_carterae.AAC.1
MLNESNLRSGIMRHGIRVGGAACLGTGEQLVCGQFCCVSSSRIQWKYAAMTRCVVSLETVIACVLSPTEEDTGVNEESSARTYKSRVPCAERRGGCRALSYAAAWKMGRSVGRGIGLRRISDERSAPRAALASSAFRQ